MERNRFFGSEKMRSALTFWLPICFLLLFFIIDQTLKWHHHLHGDKHYCFACPYSATGLEILWMYFPLMGAYLAEKDSKLFARFLLLALWTLPTLTGAKIALRFSSPDGLGFWYVGLLLEANWIYISIANLLVWIAQNWKLESAKVKRGFSTAQWHCLLYYCIPVALMIYGVIQYRAMAYFNYSETSLLLASSFTELIFVLSPVKASLSWHFRP